jgi:hypothetical protein
MNAVERLWRALRREDWEGATAQLDEHVVVRWPHTDERFDRAVDYITAQRLHGGRTRVDVRRVISEGRNVALWAVVVDHADTWHCAGVYELQDDRIAHGVELWTREGSETPAGLGRSRAAPADG